MMVKYKYKYFIKNKYKYFKYKHVHQQVADGLLQLTIDSSLIRNLYSRFERIREWENDKLR